MGATRRNRLNVSGDDRAALLELLKLGFEVAQSSVAK